jgi:cytochrome c556
MKLKLVSAAIALALGVGISGMALSQEKPESLVKQRQAKMTLQWKYLKPLYLMSRDRMPYDAKTVAQNVSYLAVLDEMAWDGFDPSTKDLKTHALPAIWSEPAKFKAAQEHLEKAVAQLVKVSKGGNEAAVKSAIGDVNDACNACHKDFREKE